MGEARVHVVSTVDPSTCHFCSVSPMRLHDSLPPKTSFYRAGKPGPCLPATEPWMGLFLGRVSLCSLSQPSSLKGVLETHLMTSCHWSANSKAECFITSANIPRGPLGAGGARERDDSEVPPPRGEGGARVGGGSGGRTEGNAVPKQSELCPVLLFVLSR